MQRIRTVGLSSHKTSPLRLRRVFDYQSEFSPEPPISLVAASKRRASSFSNGNEARSSRRRFICWATCQKARRFSASEPSTAAGSGELQCATIGWPGPDRAVLPGIITECDDEIELCVFELLPRLTVGVRCVDFEILAENFQRERMRRGFWTRSGAVGFKPSRRDCF